MTSRLPSEIVPERGRTRAASTRHWAAPAAVPAAVYLPLAAFLLAGAPGLASGVLLFAFGLFLWTLIEYGMHGGLLHYRYKSKKLYDMFAAHHAGHHEVPEDLSEVVNGLRSSLPKALVVYVLLRLVFPAPAAGAALAGVFVGYVAYELAHLAFHAPISLRFLGLEGLRKHHARHHFETPNARFGVTTRLWDAVFGTLP